MKKHCLEERLVLKPVYQIIISLLLPFASGVFAQVPINGFCQYEKFNVANNFENVFVLNFNNDSYSDIALSDPDEKSLIIYKGNSISKVADPVINKLPFSISSIHHVKAGLKNNQYVFISRKDRRIGLLEISESGKVKISSSLKVNCYPENISVADIDQDRADEVLISGCSFEGLSIYDIESGNLQKERMLLSSRNFSSAVFVDLTNDGSPDIAAIDLLENCLTFYYNDSFGGFNQVRQVSFRERISGLKSYDFNLDSFDDLLFLQGNGITVLKGDSISSYKSKISILTKNKPKKYAIADFNSDGMNDLAYLDNTISKVSVLYSKEGGDFYREIPYLNKDRLKDIIPFYSKFIKGIAALSDNGNLYMISNIKILQDNTNISLGVEPDKINYFDAGNDKIYDFFFLDKYEPYLNIVIRNNSGIPYLYYSLKMLEKHTNIIVDDKIGNRKVFYCYSKGKKLIEIITLDLDLKKANKEKLYSSGPIFDLKIYSNNSANQRAGIITAYRKANSLRVQVFSYRDFRYTVASSNDLVDNIVDAKIIAGIPIEIFYWQSGEKAYSFNKLEVNADLKPNYYKHKFSVEKDKGYKIVNFIGDVFNKEKNNAINFIISRSRKFAVISTEDKNFKVNLQNQPDNFQIDNDSNFYLGEWRFNGLNKLFVYNKSTEALEKLDIVNKRNAILSTKIVDSKNLSSYFIKNLNFKKYHLVYTDKAEKCITIKELTN